MIKSNTTKDTRIFSKTPVTMKLYLLFYQCFCKFLSLRSFFISCTSYGFVSI